MWHCGFPYKKEIRTEDIQNRVFELSCSWASSAMLQPPSSPAQRSSALEQSVETVL